MTRTAVDTAFASLLPTLDQRLSACVSAGDVVAVCASIVEAIRVDQGWSAEGADTERLNTYLRNNLRKPLKRLLDGELVLLAGIEKWGRACKFYAPGFKEFDAARKSTRQKEQLAQAARYTYDATAILEQADRALDSDEAYAVMGGLDLGLGRRAIELVVTADLVAVAPNLMMVIGLVKKRGNAAEANAIRFVPTLLDAYRLEAAFRRLRLWANTTTIGAIQDLVEFNTTSDYGKQWRKAFKDDYVELMPRLAASGIAGHEGRRFYAATLATVVVQQFGLPQVADYTRKALGEGDDSLAVAVNYFAHFGVENVPVIEIPAPDEIGKGDEVSYAVPQDIREVNVQGAAILRTRRFTWGSPAQTQAKAAVPAVKPVAKQTAPGKNRKAAEVAREIVATLIAYNNGCNDAGDKVAITKRYVDECLEALGAKQINGSGFATIMDDLHEAVIASERGIELREGWYRRTAVDGARAAGIGAILRAEIALVG